MGDDEEGGGRSPPREQEEGGRGGGRKYSTPAGGKRRREKKPLPHARRDKIMGSSAGESLSEEERNAIWSQLISNKKDELLFGRFINSNFFNGRILLN